MRPLRSPATAVRLLPALILPWLLLGAGSAIAAGPSGHRVALLIGNSQYEGAELPGAVRSLEEVEAALAKLGFAATRHENLGEKELKGVVEEFARSTPTAGVGLIYYVGFAAHVERFGKYENLLRPVDVRITNDSDYRSRGLNVSEVCRNLREQGGAHTNLLLLDASWDSPVKPESDKVISGLREFEVEPGMAVVFGGPSGEAIPLSTDDSPSPLAQAVVKHAQLFEESLRGACERIAAEAGSCWMAAAEEAGLGEASEFPVASELREGKVAGEGFINSIGMSFRWCPPGAFTMGSEQTGDSATRDRTPVEVTLSRGYWMGEHEVTQREYYAVARRTPGPDFTQHNNAPYWGVTEPKNITDFCQKLNEIERAAGRLPAGWEYVCPTEAEWEYACRAGSKTAYSFGDSPAELGQYGNFADRALRRLNPNFAYAVDISDDGVGEALALVGSYRPNAWGLRDMHGNVAEMVADDLLPQLPGGKDPLGKLEKDGRPVIRGGAWCSLPQYCESSFRNSSPGRDKSNFVGFRVALKQVK